jgi:hypothetical protein
MRVRYADMEKGAAKGYAGDRALVVEFQPGDRIPVAFNFDSQSFELSPVPKFDVVAKEHCFVRFGRNGIRVSSDGEHFDEKPKTQGRFGVGLRSEIGHPTELAVSVQTPRR